MYQATEIDSAIIIAAIEPVSRKGGKIAMSTADRLRQEGRLEGRLEGKLEGRQEGKIEGANNTYLNVIQNMKQKKISDNDIAELMNIHIDIVKKIINKEKVDLPLHILDNNNTNS